MLNIRAEEKFESRNLKKQKHGLCRRITTSRRREPASFQADGRRSRQWNVNFNLLSINIEHSGAKRV